MRSRMREDASSPSSHLSCTRRLQGLDIHDILKDSSPVDATRGVRNDIHIRCAGL